MGMLTGYERTFLTLVPAIEVTADREDAPVEELAEDWERERNAMQRRSRLRLVRGGPQQSDGHLSVPYDLVGQETPASWSWH
jgi:hypothetical protein